MKSASMLEVGRHDLRVGDFYFRGIEKCSVGIPTLEFLKRDRCQMSNRLPSTLFGRGIYNDNGNVPMRSDEIVIFLDDRRHHCLKRVGDIIGRQGEYLRA